MTNYEEEERFRKALVNQKLEEQLWNKLPSSQECGWECPCEKGECLREKGLQSL